MEIEKIIFFVILSPCLVLIIYAISYGIKTYMAHLKREKDLLEYLRKANDKFIEEMTKNGK